MEELFKQNLLTLRSRSAPRTFSEALLNSTYWSPSQKSVIRPSEAQASLSEEYSEKAQVIESLERFAREKMQEEKVNLLKVDGGEVALKTEPSWEEVRETPALDSLSLPRPLVDLVLAGKSPEKVKAIFVTEVFRPWEEVSKEPKEGLLNELLAGFALKTAEFFARMIQAMKLSSEEVILLPVEFDGKDLSAEVMGLAAHFKPEVIITLGAKASQRILKVNDRLTLIHGQFFSRKVGENSIFQVVPLFHPSIIETNQNMKKTAWTDMQKIMKHLQKLP